jgi:hypothetical protein
LAELEERGAGLILGYRRVPLKNFDCLPFTPLWSPSLILQFVGYEKEHNWTHKCAL